MPLEFISYEMILHFDEELEGSINDLNEDIKYALMSKLAGKGLIDIELTIIRTERKTNEQ